MARPIKRLVIVGCVVLALALAGFGGYQFIGSEDVQLFGEHLKRVETTEKVVALTFDDGPDDGTDDVLATLAARKVPATFYLCGVNMSKYPEQTRAIVAAGHDLGNHTWSHRRMVFISQDTIRQEVEDTDQQLRKAGFTGQITFRPPYGQKLIGLPWYLAQTGRTTVLWDVSTEEWIGPSETAQQLADSTVAATRPGSIILLHPWNDRTWVRKATEQVIDRLRAQGYRFVTVAQLLAMR